MPKAVLEDGQCATDTKLNIKHIDLAALGLGNEPVSGGINVEIKAQSDLHETHSLKLKGSDIVLDTGKKRYTPAPLDIDIATAPDGSHINARNGDFTLNGRLEGPSPYSRFRSNEFG